MSTSIIYALAGVAIICAGLFHMLAQEHLLRKVLAANITGAGIFLTLVAMADRLAEAPIDPVPHALVLTGIVVAVCSTAILLIFVCRYQDATGQTTLLEEDDPA